MNPALVVSPWLAWWCGCRAVAVALEGDDFGVVDGRSIIVAATTSSPKTCLATSPGHGRGSDVFDLRPSGERSVAGDDQGRPFVASGDELEQQVRYFWFEGDVADLVDDKQG